MKSENGALALERVMHFSRNAWQTPTASRHSAQGWDDEGVPTLGREHGNYSIPTGFCPVAYTGSFRSQPTSGLGEIGADPRVARDLATLG
jgi:hypothetical protein